MDLRDDGSPRPARQGLSESLAFSHERWRPQALGDRPPAAVSFDHPPIPVNA